MRDLDGFGCRDFLLILRCAGHPCACLLPTIQSKLQCAAARDRSEDRRKLVVVLEFEPVGQAVSGVLVHQCEKRFTIEPREHFRTEAAAERLEILFQLLRSQHFFFGNQSLMALIKARSQLVV